MQNFDFALEEVSSLKALETLKKPLLFGMVVLLLALDWAALHDITKGETNVEWEYGILYFSIFVFAMLAFAWLRKKRVSN